MQSGQLASLHFLEGYDDFSNQFLSMIKNSKCHQLLQGNEKNWNGIMNEVQISQPMMSTMMCYVGTCSG